MIKLDDKDKAFSDQAKILKQQKEILTQEKTLWNGNRMPSDIKISILHTD